MKIQRDFLLLVTLIVAATPAFGQTNDSAQGKAATPDLSGIWVHPFWPGFDPPLSGPGPVVNRSRLPSGVGNSDQLVGEYTNPLLKQWNLMISKSVNGFKCTSLSFSMTQRE